MQGHEANSDNKNIEIHQLSRKKTNEAPAKKGVFLNHIIPIFALVLYLSLALFVFFRFYNMAFPIKIERGHHHLCYPPAGTENVALIAGCIMLVFALIAHFVYIKHQKGWIKAIANIIVVSLFFGVIEVSIREFLRFHPQRYRPHPILIWELKQNPSDGNMKVNSKGLRYPEFPEKKEPNEFRFVLLGDSSAYGFGVADGSRFSDIIEVELQKRYPDRKIRVINAGVEGYSIFQGKNLYDMKIRSLSPDCLIIAFNNDPGYDIMKDEERLAPKSLRPIFGLLYKSELFLLIKKLTINKILETPEGRAKWEKKAKGQEVRRVPPEDVRKHYKYLIEDMKKRGGRTIIISMPLPDNSYFNSRNQVEYRNEIKQIAEETGSLFVDLFNLWRRDLDYKKLFADDVHPTAEGHRIIAKYLFREIVDKNIVSNIWRSEEQEKLKPSISPSPISHSLIPR